jgi:hypothetical protein
MHCNHQTAFIGWSSRDTSELTTDAHSSKRVLFRWFTSACKHVRYPFTIPTTAFATVSCTVGCTSVYWLVLACTVLVGVVVMMISLYSLNKCCFSAVPVQQTLYRTRLALYCTAFWLLPLSTWRPYCTTRVFLGFAYPTLSGPIRPCMLNDTFRVLPTPPSPLLYGHIEPYMLNDIFTGFAYPNPTLAPFSLKPL